MPILRQGEPVGVLFAANRSPKAFTRREQALLERLADQAAIALHNAHLHCEVTTQRQHLEARVQERTRELKEANQAKSQFVANMSHELRTPLNAILGFAELLEDQRVGSLAAKQQRYVHNIWTSGKHLLAIINDVLDLSKVEAGKLELHPEPVAAHEILTVALADIRPQAQAEGLALELDGAKDLPSILADPVRLKQIVLNLLSNAVKFTPGGGQVAVRVCQIGQFLQIAVQDTGIGIKPEDLPKLFQEFTQLDASLGRQHEGTGLGLALTKKLVELHGGEIRAESGGEGRGSTFTVTLPLRSPGRARPRLLLVDDDAALGESIRTALEPAGYAVEVCTDGREALARLEQSPPDLLLLDICLPGCDGREILATLRAREVTRHLPVIAFTGVEGVREEEIRTLGADEFLTKPFSATVLLQVIASFLGRASRTSPSGAPASS